MAYRAAVKTVTRVSIMREPGAISVGRAIAHMVRRSENGGLVISTAEVALRTKESFRVFLEKHIRNSHEDDDARTARFQSNSGVVAKGAKLVLDDGAAETALLDASATMATSLHQTIEAQRTASEGTIVCATYKAEKDAQATCLALLKLNTGGAFRPRKVNESNGVVVEMEELKDVLPSERERLQKAALIRRSPRPSFDLLVVDRQKRGGAEPADYFMAFLGAVFALDPSDATKRFFAAAHDGIKEAGLSYDHQELVRSAVRTALHTERVDPTALIDQLRIPKPAKEIILERLRVAVEDKAFRPDPAVAERLTKRRVFRGSHDARLSIDATVADDSSVMQVKKDGSNTIVTLRLEEWEEVRR